MCVKYLNTHTPFKNLYSQRMSQPNGIHFHLTGLTSSKCSNATEIEWRMFTYVEIRFGNIPNTNDGFTFKMFWLHSIGENFFFFSLMILFCENVLCIFVKSLLFYHWFHLFFLKTYMWYLFINETRCSCSSYENISLGTKHNCYVSR